MAITYSRHSILVTGAAGFIGSHLVEALKNTNTVISTDLSIDPRSYFSQKGLNASTIFVPGDVRDFSFISRLVTTYHVDVIFHLAAQTIVTTAYDYPKETLETNITGTISILETARLYPFIQKVIIASSDKAYGKLIKHTYKETDPLRGDHPYEASKSAADLVTTAYWKTYGTPVVVTRFGNVYGEGDLNFSRIVPDMLRSIIYNQTLLIRSDGSYTRTYLYVKDVIDAYIKIASKNDSINGEAFNFGSADKFSVRELILLTEKVLKKKIRYTIKNNSKNEIEYQSLNYQKAIKILKWKPSYSIRNVLPVIYEYYQKLSDQYVL